MILSNCDYEIAKNKLDKSEGKVRLAIKNDL